MNKDIKILTLILLVTVLIIISSCKLTKKNPVFTPENLIIITLDTTRPDFLGCYGNSQIQTPNIDRFANDSVLFKNAVSQTSTTATSHATIFTGKYPFEHGVIINGKKLPEKENTIAENMREKGYKTGAFIAAYPVAKQFGFSQGFDVFDQEGVTGEDRGYNVGRYIYKMTDLYRTAEEVNSSMFPWLTENANNNIFLWVHYFDPHKPLNPPKHFINMYKSVQIDLKHVNKPNRKYIRKYMAEISYMDMHFGKLIEHLKDINIYDNSLIIVISDHGEGLGQHNWMTHCFNVYEEAIKIAYIVKFPRSRYAGTKIDELIDTSTVYPTIMDIFNLEEGETSYSKNLINLIKNKSEKLFIEYVYGMRQLYTKEVHGTKGVKYFIRTKLWKYILPERSKEQEELYDLINDPYEQNNLILQGEKNNIKLQLKDRLLNFLEKKSKINLHDKVIINKKTEEKLKALGYTN